MNYPSSTGEERAASPAPAPSPGSGILEALAAERAGPIAGVLLAAGLSSRMGRNKLLLPFSEVSVLRHVARVAASSGLDPLLVVLGHDRARAEKELAGLAYLPVENSRYPEGIHTSLSAGFSALPEGAAAAVVVLADMPFVTARMLCELMARFRAKTARLVLSSYGGVLAPPTLYGRELFAELRALGKGCGREVVKRHREEALLLEQPPQALQDLDEPEDLASIPGRKGVSSDEG